MFRFNLYTIRITLLFLLFATTGLQANGSEPSYDKKTDKSLQNVLEDIEFAITEHNLKIVGRLHIGQGIRGRGYEEFPDYEVILYCNLNFARKMLELAPEYINACPGRFTVRKQQGSYLISGVLWPEDNDNPALNKLMYDMNVTVRKVVDHAVKEWLESE